MDGAHRWNELFHRNGCSPGVEQNVGPAAHGGYGASAVAPQAIRFQKGRLLLFKACALRQCIGNTVETRRLKWCDFQSSLPRHLAKCDQKLAGIYMNPVIDESSVQRPRVERDPFQGSCAVVNHYTADFLGSCESCRPSCCETANIANRNQSMEPNWGFSIRASTSPCTSTPPTLPRSAAPITLSRSLVPCRQLRRAESKIEPVKAR